MSKSDYKQTTKIVRGCKGGDPVTGAVSYPIYQSATFSHPGLYQTTGYDYSRLQNPTREEVENVIATLEGGRHGLGFATGMAAVSTVIGLFNPGDHVLVSDDLYGGTYRLFEEYFNRFGVVFEFTDTSDIQSVQDKMQSRTRAVFIETPSNPMMKITDIKAVSRIAKQAGALTVVDNTFLTPYYQRPLELGADIVLHSGTKYLGGHNDTLAGFVVTDDVQLAEKMRLIQKTTGGVLAPFDSWLILRGIKTLAIRMDKQQENAFRIANWLKTHRKVKEVNYAGLPESPGYEISARQANGFGGMISFEVDSVETVERVLERVRLIIFAESLGGVESLITYPVAQTHTAIPQEIRDRIGVNDRLIRLSVGIEAVEDILADLEQALF